MELKLSICDSRSCWPLLTLAPFIHFALGLTASAEGPTVPLKLNYKCAIFLDTRQPPSTRVLIQVSSDVSNHINVATGESNKERE